MYVTQTKRNELIFSHFTSFNTFVLKLSLALTQLNFNVFIAIWVGRFHEIATICCSENDFTVFRSLLRYLIIQMIPSALYLQYTTRRVFFGRNQCDFWCKYNIIFIIAVWTSYILVALVYGFYGFISYIWSKLLSVTLQWHTYFIQIKRKERRK